MPCLTRFRISILNEMGRYQRSLNTVRRFWGGGLLWQLSTMLTHFCDHVIHIHLPPVTIKSMRVQITSLAQHAECPNAADGKDLENIY